MAQDQRKGCLRWVVRVALVVAVGMGVLAGVGLWYWNTGEPQRWLVAQGVRSTVGAHAEVEGVSIWGAAKAERIVLRDPPGDTCREALLTAKRFPWAAIVFVGSTPRTCRTHGTVDISWKRARAHFSVAIYSPKAAWIFPR